jgi:ATPase subunit of ABC transporter with duplicated ATPase domains
MTTKKYAYRPSPPYPANKCQGIAKIGNDGRMYQSVPDKNGIYKWMLDKSENTKNISRKSRKVSRKTQRKSRKASRKTQRKSRKVSRKTQRKSRKASRKTQRKSRKVSRKTQRKSRKVSRKTQRKSRKVSRKTKFTLKVQISSDDGKNDENYIIVKNVGKIPSNVKKSLNIFFKNEMPIGINSGNDNNDNIIEINKISYGNEGFVKIYASSIYPLNYINKSRGINFSLKDSIEVYNEKSIWQAMSNIKGSDGLLYNTSSIKIQ